MDALDHTFFRRSTGPKKLLGNCIRWYARMHLTSMNLNSEELTLATAARLGEPGALRALAMILDERLAEEDSSLDPAVLAWQAAAGGRSQTGRQLIAGLRRQLAGIRRGIAGRRPGPAAPIAVHQAPLTAPWPLVHRRPAA